MAASDYDKELAYNAGRAVLSGDPEFRKVEACPFSPVEHPEQRAEWLRGFAESVEESQPDLDAIREELNKVNG